MQSTPDLSKIVNLIMQNPQLIEQISALANQEESSAKAVDTHESEEVFLGEEADQTQKRDMRSHRHELLCAMKPYLSEKRRSAIDSMSSILDILDVMMKK